MIVMLKVCINKLNYLKAMLMNITKISKTNFMGKIIDSHAHIGKHNRGCYIKSDLDVFVKSELPNKDTVEKMLVSDLDVLHGIKNEYEGNKLALETFKNNEKYSLLASCNPKDGEISNIKKLFKDYPSGFVGLKFHSDIQQLDLDNKKYEPYLEFASKKKLPCLFHSQVELFEGGKVNPSIKHIADPESIYALAKKYPKTPIVMAHLGAGWNEAHDKATDILIESIKKGDANLYADISWVDIDQEHTHVVKTIKRLKGIGEKGWIYGDQTHRLMFGTDAPIDRFKKEDSRKIYSDFVDKIKESIRKDKDLKNDAEKIIEDLFYNNAKKLYLSNKNESSKSYKKFLVLGIVAAIGIGIYAICKNDKENSARKSYIN